jgi:hypothetical protein
LAGFPRREPEAAPAADQAPSFVRTVAVIAGGDVQLWLSGTVRAHVETPLAYVLIGGLALGTAITLLLLSRAISDWPT